MSSIKKYYYEIDVLRGIACLTVFFSHFPLHGMAGSFWDVAGCNGVYLFFVISGFIISKTFGHQLEKIDNFSLKDWRLVIKKNLVHIYLFWHRRFIRLFPALLFLCSCLAIVSIHYGIKHNMLFETMIEFFRLVANFLLLDNCMNNEYNDISRFMYWKVGVIWSLDCEILFYLLFPLIIVLKRVNLILLYLFIFIVFAKSLLYTFIEFKYIYYGLLANFDFFILGILISEYHDKIKLNKRFLFLFTWVSLYTLIITSPSFEIYRFYLNGIIVSGVLVYVASIGQNILRFPILSNILHFIGVRSYFIYLTHVIIKHMIEIFIINHSNDYSTIYKSTIFSKYANNLLLLIFAIILSDLFYRYIEKPYTKRNRDNYITPTSK